MRKCVFIIPFFGKFNNYFQLYLNSCECNSDFDWLIFTDDRYEYNYPANVHVIYMTFDDLRRFIQSKFKFKISLHDPYKLCDYKVAYGYLFEEYICDYSHWGYCDCDLIFGKLSEFITDDLLSEYDKLFTVGHLCIYKNNYDNNRFFMSKYKGEYMYRKILSNEKNFAFDELAINDMYAESDCKMYAVDMSANISVYSHRFCLTKRIDDAKRYFTENYIPAVFLWDNGEIIRVFISEDDGKKKICKFPYLHLQHRKMKIMENIDNTTSYQILPNRFFKGNLQNTLENFNHIKKYTFSLRSILQCNWVNVRWKIKCFMNRIFLGKFTRGNM